MIKTLSIEKSNDLIGLGIDPKNASQAEVSITENEHRAEMFTDSDLIRLLPKWIKHRNMLLWLHIYVDEHTDEWCVEYKCGEYGVDEAENCQSSKELVNCLYEMLRYLINNNYMRIERGG